ncbi:hypothetical protein [Geobacter sulfurreducens]|uniref:hypothetical protein n=1 Tax=Geobacter sulfurreducens TaxID=35554 RepID=UPI000DBB5D58|nr:hypothetical protein [Geobacter sulfurreducens]BBA69462.1 hypothetical protein YM18_0915 [Geobacter sulfurreducens]
MKARIGTLTFVLGGVSPAFASVGEAEGFQGVFTTVFICYCAIVVVAQTIAAIRSLIGSGSTRGAVPPAESQKT